MKPEPAERGQLGTVRQLLARPGLKGLLAADVVSRIGSQFATLALPWFVLVTSGSATRMGLVFAVELVPVVILGIPSGSVVARFGSRQVMIAGDVVQALLISLVPILHLAGLLPFWTLLVIVACTGAISAPYLAAQRTVIPDLAGSDEAVVTACNTLVETSTWTSRLIGPSVAGLAIAWMGALNLLWIDAATFVFSAVALIGVPRRDATSEPGEPGGSGQAPTGGLFDGVRCVLSDRVLRRLAAVATGYGMLIPVITLSLPLLAVSRYGGNPRVAGWLFGAWGAGAVCGSLGVMRLAGRITPLRIGALAAVGICVPTWFLPLHQPALTVGAIMLVSGMFIPALNAPLISLISTRAPRALLAQVMAVVVTANLVAGPVAYVGAGWLFSVVGTGPVLLAVAAGLTACAAGLMTLVATRAPTTGDNVVPLVPSEP